MKFAIIFSFASLAIALPVPQRFGRTCSVVQHAKIILKANGCLVPLLGLAGAGLRGGLGLANLAGLGIANLGLGLLPIGGGLLDIGFGVAQGIGEGISDALNGGWGDDDWDDYYRKLAVDGVDVSELPPVATMVAYTNALRAEAQTQGAVSNAAPAA
jgi:hypothetical protein